MDKQTKICTTAAVIAFIINAINTLCGTNFNITNEIITSISILVVTLFVWAQAHWYNQSYTDAGKIGTKITHALKQGLEFVGIDELQDLATKKDTIIYTTTSIVMFGLNAINSICNTNFSVASDTITTVATLIFVLITWFCSLWFNQSFTLEGLVGTKTTKELKLQEPDLEFNACEIANVLEVTNPIDND